MIKAIVTKLLNCIAYKHEHRATRAVILPAPHQHRTR